MVDETDAQIAQRLKAEGEMWDLLKQFKEVGYLAVAFNCWSKHLPQSMDWRGLYPGTRRLDGHTFALPSQELVKQCRKQFEWPPIWRILQKFYGKGTAGNSHQYQLAPACGMRVFVLEDGEWVEKNDEEKT